MEGSWYCDGWSDNLKIFHRVRRTLFAGASPYQKIEVVESCDFGRLLIIDGLPQAAERDEMVYARAIAWPALLGLPGTKRVLITGGGDGHVLREVLRFPSVESALVCDIDPTVLQVTSELMPFMWGNARADGRALIQHRDALELLRECAPGSFDVVISDITDPTGEGTASHALYSPEYFRLIKRALVRGGVCVAQAQELSVRDWAHHQRLRDVIGAVFGAVRSGQVYVPSFGYPEGLIFASDHSQALEVGRPEVERRLAESGLADDPYFDGAMYEAMFVLPPLIHAALSRT